MTPFLDKISQISIPDLFIQHLGTLNCSLGVVEHPEVFWDEISSCTHGQGCSGIISAVTQVKTPQLTLRLSSHGGRSHRNSPELRRTFFPPFPTEAPVLPNPGSSPTLCRPSFTAQTCTCATVFVWNILLKTWWHSTKPHH